MATNVTFKKVHTANRGASTYRATGFPGVILLAKPAFNGEHPDEFVIAEVPDPVAGSAAPKTPKVKRTKEELAAARATEKARWEALTPEQKAQEMRDKAAKRREEAAVALKKAEERAAKFAAPATDAPVDPAV